MKIYDLNGNVIENPDLSLGYLTQDKRLVAHHEAVEAVEGRWHYETIREYPNGGRDVKQVWDVEPVEAKAAWDEYEDIQIYHEYTAEELAELEKQKQEAEDNAPVSWIALKKAYEEGVLSA